jgi:hypothetical protein
MVMVKEKSAKVTMILGASKKSEAKWATAMLMMMGEKVSKEKLAIIVSLRLLTVKERETNILHLSAFSSPPYEWKAKCGHMDDVERKSGKGDDGGGGGRRKGTKDGNGHDGAKGDVDDDDDDKRKSTLLEG